MILALRVPGLLAKLLRSSQELFTKEPLLLREELDGFSCGERLIILWDALVALRVMKIF